MTPLRNNGKALEGQITAALKAYQADHAARCHRFADTTAAGGKFLGPQPGDFMLLVPGFSIMIEAKSTDCGAGLLSLIRSSANAKKQVAQHRMWHRAGHPSWYWWADVTAGEFRVYDGREVVRAQFGEAAPGSLGGLLAGGRLGKAGAVKDELAAVAKMVKLLTAL